LAADYVVMALAPNLFWLFLGRLVSGVTAATLAAANAYIADITPPDKRASRFGLLSAAFGIGLVLGPALGGLLADMSLRAPFWLAAGLTFANALFGLFVLPESLPKARRSEFNFRMANPLGSIDLYRAHPGLLPLAGVMFLFVMSQNVLASVWVPYVDHRFGWPSRVVGLTLAAVGIATIVVQALVVKRAVGRFGERGAVVIGLLAGAAGLAIYGVANGFVVFLAAIAVFSLSGLISPGAQGMMSRSVSASEQGRLQGANMAVNSLAALISPILFTEIFARAIGPWRGWAPPGLPFYLAACLLIGALLLVAAAARRNRAEP
jgi:MFS transporter, DHA1 family, tetracycline resistance protein